MTNNKVKRRFEELATEPSAIIIEPSVSFANINQPIQHLTASQSVAVFLAFPGVERIPRRDPPRECESY